MRTMPSGELSFEDLFRANSGNYVRLVEEVKFILKDLVDQHDIKIHSISGRVKDIRSIAEKIERKGYAGPGEQLEDIVGCRVVCLFIADLEKLETAIVNEFKVHRAEDKVAGIEDEATFGYMSKHYICQLSGRHLGSRYNELKKYRFEIQCRTLLMDAWANVSHYLAYKGKYSIPAGLQRDFYALSGLFYVADKHFELFLNEAVTSEEEVIAKASAGQLTELDDEDINLETVRALLTELYPDRKRSARQNISSFVEEVASHGYVKLSQLKGDLERAQDAAVRYEKKYPPSVSKTEIDHSRFADVGIARQAIGIIHGDGDSRLAEFRQFLSQS
jgi:ppGpp synthetase/RelA/SpoT-type nucleotidyltranferase